MVKKTWYTYDDIHKVVKQVAEKVQNSGVKYDAMIAIGGRRLYSGAYVALLFGYPDLCGQHGVLFG